jgi:4-amino-4-deoxy-L-arabinose transferase-like glycosyltransferase
MKFPALRRQVVSGYLSILVLISVACLIVVGLTHVINLPEPAWLLLLLTYLVVGYCRMRQADIITAAIAIYADHWAKVMFTVVVGILLWPVRRLVVSLALLAVGR